MIKCQRCGQEYIGETGRTIKERIDEHIRYIRNIESHHPTGKHFNMYGHSLRDFSWMGFEKISQDSKTFRRTRETFRINQFQTLEPTGMNKYT